MPQDTSRNASTNRPQASFWTAAGTVATLLFFLVGGTLTYSNVQALEVSNEATLHSQAVIDALSGLLSTMQDAETGQRGFLLTGKDTYLQPYDAALTKQVSELDDLAVLTADNPIQQANFRQLRPHVAAKLAELKETIELRRAEGAAAALAVVNTDRGKLEMDAIRVRLVIMGQEEVRLREARRTQMWSAHRTALSSGVLTTLLGMALTLLVGYLFLRNVRARQREAWLHTGQVGLAEAMLGDKTVGQLGDNILDFLVPLLGAQAGVLFKGEGSTFHRVAQLGVPADAAVPEHFALREGLLGSVAAAGQSVILHDVPENYLIVGSALGRYQPRHLVIAPFSADGRVNAVVELGFLHPVEARVLTFLDEVAAAAGVALRSARYRADLHTLLEEASDSVCRRGLTPYKISYANSVAR